MHLQFESFYKISMLALRTTGAHPCVEKNYKWVIRFLLMHGYFTFCAIFFTYNMIFIDIKELKDVTKACSHGILLVLYVVVTFFYLVLLWYQDDVKVIFKLQQSYFDSASDLPVEDQNIVYDYAKKGRWVSKLWLVSTLLTMGMFPLKGGIMTIYSIYNGNLTLYPMTDNIYPSGIEEIKLRYDVFAIFYCMSTLYAIYSLLIYTGFSPLGPILILNTCAQVEILTKKVHLLIDKKKEFNREEVERKLKNTAQQLQEIYSFVKNVNGVFKVVYELCLKASAVLIPVSMIVIIKMLERREIGLDYIMFIYTALLLCFVPCYYSDLLLEKSNNLRIALYSTGWENFYDRGTRSSLLILLTRASKPISINSVFCTVCLDTFSDSFSMKENIVRKPARICELCHQSYALFNLMNAGLK